MKVESKASFREASPVTAETLDARAHPKVLASVLSYLAQDQPWKERNQTTSLPLDKILFQSWAPRRTKRAMAYFSAGSPFPPISVFAYRIPAPEVMTTEQKQPFEDVSTVQYPGGVKTSQTRKLLTFYDVNDGNHRCAAAEECGETSIQAEVSGEVTIDPAGFVLFDQKLWHLEGSSMRLVSEPDSLSMQYFRLWIPEYE